MLIRDFYTAGVATKDEYAKALHQANLDDIRSNQRDAAASDWERFLDTMNPIPVTLYN